MNRIDLKVAFGLALFSALSLLAGCAGSQPRPSSMAEDTSQPPRSGGTVAAADDSPAALFKAMPNAPEPKMNEDERAGFDNAVANYQRLKKDGSLKGKDCDDAASGFRKVADRSPQMLIARHNEAAVLFECDRRPEATRIWEDLGRKGYAAALAQLGFNAWQSGQTGEAESQFRRAIQADPQLPSISARINLAQILREKARRARGAEKDKHNDDAQTELRKALALDGNNLLVYATLCYLYYDSNRPDGAVLVAQQAIKKAEEIATGKFEDEEVGDAAEKPVPKKKGRKDDDEPAPRRVKVAVRATGWTPEMKKHIAVVYNTLGMVELEKKRFSQAISHYKKAVELDPELHEARLNLAALSLKFRDYAAAEDNFKAVQAAQPRNYDATIGYGVALRGSRKFEEAEQQYLNAQKLDPNRGDSYFNLGLLYQEYKGSEKATLQKGQQHYREFLNKDGGSSAMKRDAQKRIKDIDELFVALEEAAKLQAEAEALQRKAEEQQKKMEEEMKKQDEREKNKAGAVSGGGDAASAGVAPPPAAP